MEPKKVYIITVGTEGIEFGCMDCPYCVRVNDYKNKLGRACTQAANAIDNHLKTHRMTRVQPMPRRGSSSV